MKTNSRPGFLRNGNRTRQKKRPVSFLKRVSFSKTAATYSPTLAVPSARSGLTSLFGMGRGGTPTL